MRGILLLAAAFATFGATAAAAQAPGAPGDSVPADTIPLEPLEVSVLRSLTAVEAAPMAVAALTEEELRRGRSGVFLEEALQGLPGVQVQNRFNPAVGERVAIRGFGARAQFGMRGIRVVVDGIPATLPDGQSTLDHLDIGSLGRVEVVRGPASALFGNASGGVLTFHTRPPAPAPFRLEVEQVLGSHGLGRTQSTASGTLGETGYLLSLSRVAWDGFRSVPDTDGEETYGESERFGVNARLLRPAAGGQISLTLNAMDLEAENPGSVTEELRDDPDRPVVAFPYLVHGTRKELRQGEGGLRWEGPLRGSLEAEAAIFGGSRSVVNPIPFNYIDLGRTTLGARTRIGDEIPTDRGPLRWHAGLEHQRQDDDRVEFPNEEGLPGEEARTDQAERVRSTGVFLQAELPLPGGARALSGLRYDRHAFAADDRMERDEASATGERTMDAVSPSIGLNVPVRGAFNLFASVGTVFETPSTTELKNRPEAAGGFNPDLEPQRGTATEAGVRGRMGGVASFELTAFRTELRNELVPFEVPAAEGQVFFRNAGSSRHTGVEATVSAATRSGLLRGDLTYSRTNARFRAYQVEGEELGGNRVPGLAPHRAQVILRATPGAWHAGLTGTWSDEIPMDDQNTASAPSHVLLDLRGGLEELAVGGVGFAPWVAVTNLLDRRYTASAAVNAAGGRYYEPGPGRSFQVGVRASF